MRVNKSHSALSLDLSKPERGGSNFRRKGEGSGACVRGGGCRQQSAAFAKGPPVCAALATPSAGPRSIQTQSNKAFPLSSPQNTKQSGEGKGRRGGEEGEELFR